MPANAVNIQAGAAVVNIIANDEQLKNVLEGATKSLQNFANITAAIANKLRVAGALMLAPFQDAARIFADFDARMRTVVAVTSSSGEEFDKLTEKAKQLGASTTFTASQVADGMAALGRMGFNSSEIDKAIKSMMDLSLATGTELAQASEIAANNMRVFNMQASDMTKIADILAFTANSSAQRLEDMGEALKTAGPVAARTGQTLEQVSAQLGILANMGIRGSMAGTALARSYKQLADPKIQKMLKDTFDISVTENGQMRDMAIVFADIGKAVSALPNASQVSILEDIFNARGSLGGGTLSINAKAIADFMEKYKEANGYAAKTSETMQSGLKGSMDAVASAFEGVSIAIGNALQGPLSAFNKWLAATSQKVIAFIGEHKGLIIAVGALAAVLATLGTVLATVSSAIGVYTALSHACTIAYNASLAPLLARIATLKLETVATTAQCLADSEEIMGKIAMSAQNAIVAGTEALVAKAKLTTAAASGSLLAIMLKSIAAAILTATKNIFLAGTFTVVTVAAKAAAIGTGLFNAALKLLCAHPIIAALMAIAAAAYLIYQHFKKAVEQAVKLSKTRLQNMEDRRTRQRKADDRENKRDETDFMRLRELSAKVTLNTDEMKEAEIIMKRLKDRGFGALLPVLDKANSKIGEMASNAAEAAEKVMETNRLNAIARERGSAAAELEAINKEYRDFTEKGLKAGAKWSGSALEYDKYREELDEKRRKLQERIEELQNEYASAAQEAQRKQTAQAEAALEQKRQKAHETATKQAEIEKELADKKKTAIEKELEAIEAQKQGYKEAIQAQLEYEKAKAKVDSAKVKELEEKLKAADAMFQGMSDAALEKHYKDSGAIDIHNDWIDTRVASADSIKQAAQDRRLDALREQGPQAYTNALKKVYSALALKLKEAADMYQEALDRAKGEDSESGKMLSENERKELEEQQKYYASLKERLDDMKGRLIQAADETERQQEDNSPDRIGSFIAQAFAFQGAKKIDDRTAKATENTAKNTADTLRWLQNHDFNRAFT